MILRPEVKIKPPQLPNFLLEDGGDRKWPIASFSDAQLQAVGEEWTKNLIELARQRRKQSA